MQMLDVEALEWALRNPDFRAAIAAAQDPTTLLRQAMPMAKSAHVDFFAACFVHAPELTLLLLDGVRRYPSQRPSALALAESLVERAAQLDGQSCKTVAAYFAYHPNAAAEDAYFNRMEHYENLLAAGA